MKITRAGCVNVCTQATSPELNPTLPSFGIKRVKIGYYGDYKMTLWLL